MRLPVCGAMPAARPRRRPPAPACCCPVSARASSRWRRGSTPHRCRPTINRCTTWWPQADWDDAAVLAAVRALGLPAIERQGPVLYGSVDDTSVPKQGTHAVGVARQYCGPLGKQDNCQVAVSLSVANNHASLPIAYRLFVPEAWANDPLRRAKAGVPAAVAFDSKTAIALGPLHQALADGVPVGIVLGDPASHE